MASSAITQVSRTNSGYAVIAVSENLRKALLAESSRLEGTELKLEPSSKWITVLAPNVLDRLLLLDGVAQVTPDMEIEETARKTGARPTSASVKERK